MDSYSKKVPSILEEESRVRIGKQILAILKNEIGDTAKLTCLDIGCSSGVITKLLAKNFAKTTGVDTDQQAINIARIDPNGATFVRIGDETLPFKDNKFDVIVCNQVYEFVEDQVLLAQEMRRVLKKEGVCFLGARNKLSFIEGQTGLPLLHFLPCSLALKIASLFGKSYYPANYRTYDELCRLFSDMQINNITLKVIKNPRRYKFSKIEKYAPIFKVIPQGLLSMLNPLIPNYLLLLRK